MAYRTRRRSTRRSSGYSRGRSYGAPRRRRATTSRRRGSVRRASRPQTVRIVVQTVGASPAAQQSAVSPLRAMF